MVMWHFINYFIPHSASGFNNVLLLQVFEQLKLLERLNLIEGKKRGDGRNESQGYLRKPIKHLAWRVRRILSSHEPIEKTAGYVHNLISSA